MLDPASGGTNIPNLAVNWLGYESTYWSRDRLDALITADPETAWDVITQLIAQTDTSGLLNYIGAAPLEDLVNQHTAQFVDRMESLAHTDPKFRYALASVWPHSGISLPLWQRLATACGSQFSPPPKTPPVDDA